MSLAALLWDFGTDSQLPILRADLNGDGVATSAEFGLQGGRPYVSFAAPTSSARETFTPAYTEISLSVHDGPLASDARLGITVDAPGLTTDECTLRLHGESPGQLERLGPFRYALTVPAATTEQTLRFLSYDGDVSDDLITLILSPLGGIAPGSPRRHLLSVTDARDDHHDDPPRPRHAHCAHLARCRPGAAGRDCQLRRGQQRRGGYQRGLGSGS